MNRLVPQKTAVTAAFSAAAGSYDENADVQRAVARRLASRIAGLSLPPVPKILEIGCGTGFLTGAVRQAIPQAAWTVTDISPSMVEQCRARFGADGNTVFFAMDGEAPDFAPDTHFDLICSSLAFQWFEDLPAALERLASLLTPGGHLVFATLAADSFAEWRQACMGIDRAPALLDCLSPADILRAMPPSGRAHIEDERIAQPYAHGRAFLEQLRRIGAHAPPRGHHPASPGTLRQVLRRYDSVPDIKVTYHVAYGTFTRG